MEPITAAGVRTESRKEIRVRSEEAGTVREDEVESEIVREGVPQEKDSLPIFIFSVVRVVLVSGVFLEEDKTSSKKRPEEGTRKTGT